MKTQAFRYRALALIAIVTIFSLAAACPSRGTAKTTKHKLAIYTADGDTALIAVTDSVEALQGAGRLTPAAAKNIYQS